MTEPRRTGWEEIDRWFAAPPAGGDGGDGGDGGPTPPAAADAPPPEPRCATCGADLEPDQTYCLECGSPTPLAPRLRRGGRNALVLAGALAVLGLGAGALAYAVATDDDDPALTSPTALTTTAPLVPLPPETAATTGALPPDTSFTTPAVPPDTTFTTPTTGFDTVTGPGIVTAPTDTTGFTDPLPEPVPDPAPDPVPDPDPLPDPDTGASDWPAGTTAWTAILSSVRNEADARAAKSQVAGGGQPAGVLYSSDFADLRPGYWVVFSGRFSDRGEAIAQATRMRPGFPGAYARRLSG